MTKNFLNIIFLSNYYNTFIKYLYNTKYNVTKKYNTKQMLSQTDLKILRKSVPFGEVKNIVELCNKKGIIASYAVVSAALRGHTYNQEILDIAIDYVIERKKNEEKVTEETRKKIQSIV